MDFLLKFLSGKKPLCLNMLIFRELTSRSSLYLCFLNTEIFFEGFQIQTIAFRQKIVWQMGELSSKNSMSDGGQLINFKYRQSTRAKKKRNN